MFQRFTDRARAIVSIAQEAAGGDPDSVNLLEAMLQSGGIAGNVLLEFGLTTEAISLSHDAPHMFPDVSLAEFETRALAETIPLRHNYAGTEHMLLALCCLPQSRASQVLASLQLDRREICKLVLEILGHEEKWPEWLTAHPELASSP